MVICADDADALAVLNAMPSETAAKAVAYGTSDPAELELNGAAYVRIVAESESAGSGVERFTLNVPADVAGESAFDLAVELAVPGVHNARNAAAALTAAMLLGVEPEAAAKAVADFRGAARRFQVRGTVKQVTVVDDYAHQSHSKSPRCWTPTRRRYPETHHPRTVPAAPVLPYEVLRARIRGSTRQGR